MNLQKRIYKSEIPFVFLICAIYGYLILEHYFALPFYPDNLMYVFTGPVDSRTSDICLQILAAGPMTLKQIDNNFPGTFLNGGHFNCRHQFRRYTSKEMYKENIIEKQFDKRDLTQRTSL